MFYKFSFLKLWFSRWTCANKRVLGEMMWNATYICQLWAGSWLNNCFNSFISGIMEIKYFRITAWLHGWATRESDANLCWEGAGGEGSTIKATARFHPKSIIMHLMSRNDEQQSSSETAFDSFPIFLHRQKGLMYKPH